MRLALIFGRFTQEDEGNVGFFVPSKKEAHWMFDLPAYCEHRLLGCGIDHILQSWVDTYANEEQYFSYRRTTHNGEDDYGGQISVIMIKST